MFNVYSQDLSIIGTRASREWTLIIRSLWVCGEESRQELPSAPPYKWPTPTLLTSSPDSVSIASVMSLSTYVNRP